MARFSVWNGVSINPAYRDLADIRDAVYSLKPDGFTAEWLVKAGEGGTWQAAWDPHPLALDGMGKLIDIYRQGQGLKPKLKVTPYVVVRGREEWNEAEWRQIAEAAFVNNRVALNLEDGAPYWNGPTNAERLREEYLRPMMRVLRSVAPYARVQVTAIPREWVVDDLGGPACIRSWLDVATEASWECYGLVASDLLVDRAMARVRGWLDGCGCFEKPRYRVPLVQRGEIDRWAGTEYTAAGLEVWHLDGDV